MTSIYDIPYEDIQIFLLANNENIRNRNDAYDVALELLKNKNAKGHTTSIIEWMMAHNLLIKKVNIPIYTTYEIDNMSQVEINKLAKLLTMKGNNRNNIKNILRYLNKLQDNKEFLIADINDIILSTLTKLELQNINISNLNYDDVINLLKTHRNKKEIRKFISNNLGKIIIYNSLQLDFDSLNIVYISDDVNVYNKNIIIELIIDNKEQLKKIYSDKEINNLIKKAKEKDEDQEGKVYIGTSKMNDLIDFTFSLITINEIGLAKKVFDIANEQHYFGRDRRYNFPYNYELIEQLIFFDDANILKTIINFMGEDGVLRIFEEILEEEILEKESPPNIYIFSKNLLKLKKYDLLYKILLSYYNYDHSTANKLLQKLKKSIESRDDDLILKYLNFI